MKNETEDWIVGLIFDGAPAMDELQRVDQQLEDPMRKFLDRRDMELYLSKSSTGLEQPSWDETIGADQDDEDSHLEKRLETFENLFSIE